MRVRVGMWPGQPMGDLRVGDGDGEVARRTVGDPLAPCMNQTIKPSDMHTQRGAGVACTQLAHGARGVPRQEPSGATSNPAWAHLHHSSLLHN